MGTDVYLILAIAGMTVATFLTRALPFLVLREGADHPLVLYLGRYLPAAVMTLLVIYCVKDVEFLSAPYGLPQLAGIGVTAAVHLWRRNALLSIAAGTGLFMLLLRI
ncbi:MAG: AzlD domain-containing protein [Ectothiorhodospiraceae bacterium]|jgi:branched-subunit amino acid transport protein AzlD